MKFINNKFFNSYRYYQREIQSDRSLHVWTVLEYRNHVAACYCKLLVKLHSLVHGNLVPDDSPHIFVSADSKFAKMADPKRKGQWSQGSSAGSSANQRKNWFLGSWLGEATPDSSSSCSGSSTRAIVLGNVERAGKELDCSAFVLGNYCEWLWLNLI